MTGHGRPRISEPKRDAFSRWHGDDAARRAVYGNRARLLTGVARQAFKLRAELVERGFALILDRGGMRRVWLLGRENVHKGYLIHVAGYNLGVGHAAADRSRNAKGVHAQASVWLGVSSATDHTWILIVFVAVGDLIAAIAVSFQVDPFA